MGSHFVVSAILFDRRGKRVSGKVCCTTGMHTATVGYSVNGDILQI